MTNTSSMDETGHSRLVFWDSPEGWEGEGHQRGLQDEGTYVDPWPIHVYVWKKLPQYCKQISLQLN